MKYVSNQAQTPFLILQYQNFVSVLLISIYIVFQKVLEEEKDRKKITNITTGSTEEGSSGISKDNATFNDTKTLLKQLKCLLKKLYKNWSEGQSSKVTIPQQRF